jgi:hypothetical protein
MVVVEEMVGVMVEVMVEDKEMVEVMV